MANETVNRYLNIYITSGEAQKVYDKLIAKQKQLNDQLAANPKNAAKIRQELARLEEPIDRAAKKLKGELNPSLRDTQTAVTNVTNRLKRMSDTDADYSKVVAQFRQGNKELDEQRNKVGLINRAMRSFWQEAKTVAVGVVIGNTVQSMLETVMGYVSGIVTGSAKLSDELADIQRVTGLTATEVKEINSELKKIDTRTSTAALREIVLVAGRLGIEGKENLVSFTEAIDKLNIALGGELGDINTFTTDLGKILNVFEGKITAENITAVGNAIVDLANKGVASGPFIVDFTQRVSGIAKASNLSLSATVGLAAGLEETGNRVESSATAIQKLITTIGQDIPKAAKIAGVEANKFAKIFAETPEKALLLFAQGLQRNKGSFAEIAAGFKDAGEEGARVISVLSVLGQRTELFEEKIKDAGIALKDTTAITAAFELKNNNAGAALDKFKKNFASLFTSPTFIAAGETAIKLMNNFVNIIKGIPEFVRENKVALLTLTAGILLLNKAYVASALASIRDTAAKWLNVAATKAGAIATNLSVTAQAAYITITNLLTGRITAATAAQRLWNIAMSLGAGGLGILLVTVGALAIALRNAFTRTRQLTAEQKTNAEIQKRANEATRETIERTRTLAEVIADANVSLDNRKKALAELQQASGGYLNALNLENAATAEGKNLIDQYVNSLIKRAEAEARFQVLVEKIKKRDELFNSFRSQSGNQNLTDADIEKEIRKQADKSISFLDIRQDRPLINAFRNMREELDEITRLQKQITDAAKTNVETISSTTSNIVSTAAAATEEDKKTIEKTKDDLEKLAEELQKIRSELTAAGLSEFDAAIFRLDEKYNDLRNRASGNKKLLLEIDRLYWIESGKITDEYILKYLQKMSKLEEADKKREEERLKRLADMANGLFSDKILGQIEGAQDYVNRDRLAKAELDAATATGRERLEAQLRLLEEQKRQELANKNLTEQEKLLIEQQYNEKRKELEREFQVQRMQLVLGYAQQVLDIISIFDQAKTEKENAELERDRVLNDKKKRNLDTRLKQGIISQVQYDRELQRMEKEMEKREKEIRVKQFKRDQRAQIIQAVMSGAQAVVSTLAARPGSADVATLGVMRAVQIALAIATTVAQVAKIASQKPPAYARGGMLGGRSHAQGGNAIIDGNGRKIAEIEKGEGIINKHSMASRNRYTLSGTPSQIASMLNAKYGGVSWEAGASLQPAWSIRKAVPMNFPAIRRYFAEGGVFKDTVANAGNSTSEVMNGLVMTMQQMNITIAEMQFTLAKGIRSKVYITEFEDEQERLNTIREDAALK